MERSLSIAGKLFLSGEYAVLWGGVARIVALGPRLSACVRRRSDADVQVVLEEGLLRGKVTPKGVLWEGQVPEGFRFIARALDEALRVHGKASLGFDLAVTPAPMAPGGQKLGLGGSASVTVLATEAARFVLEERFDVLKLALVAHGLGQGNLGSGGDVATSFAGGAIRYRRYNIDALAAASATGRYRAALAEAPPVDLYRLAALKPLLAYAFTGQSASTRTQVHQVEQGLTSEAKTAFVARSDELGQAVEAGLTGNDFQGFREAIQAQQALLSELRSTETESMRRIIALAETYGCAAKLSGAGGGDGCILFAPDEDRREALLDALRSREWWALPLSPESGLRGEPVAEPMLRGWLDAHA